MKKTCLIISLLLCASINLANIPQKKLGPYPEPYTMDKNYYGDSKEFANAFHKFFVRKLKPEDPIITIPGIKEVIILSLEAGYISGYTDAVQEIKEAMKKEADKRAVKKGTNERQS